jgi:hypothetical protein
MFRFLRPTKINIGLAAVVSLLPFIVEHVQLENGGVVIERYSPAQLLIGYAFMGEIAAFVMVVGLCLVIYFFSSLIILLLRKLGKLINFKKLTAI